MMTIFPCQEAAWLHSSARVGEAGPDLFRVLSKAEIQKRTFRRNLLNITTVLMSMYLLSTLKYPQKLRLRLRLAILWQHNSSFSLHLCQERWPSFQAFCSRSQNREAHFILTKVNREETRLWFWQHQTQHALYHCQCKIHDSSSIIKPILTPAPCRMRPHYLYLSLPAATRSSPELHGQLNH